jgi:DNA-binding PadR family transcriptional regulator
MFYRGHHSEDVHGKDRHRGRHGGFGEFFGNFERGFGGRERMFDTGELRLVILQSLAVKPSYGYEIIKAVEEQLAGAYSPSPGVVYPTLTMLEEEGYAVVASTEGNKKRYAATEHGLEHLKQHQGILEAIGHRMEKMGKAYGQERAPQIMRAIMNLKFALKMRARSGKLSPEQTRKIAEAIDAAARVIDEA